MTARMIYCQKLQQQAEGLSRVPYTGELGKRIYENISKAAWQLWLQRQTLFINEKRLDVRTPAAKQLLQTEMENFLFGQVDRKPEGYIPPHKDEH